MTKPAPDQATPPFKTCGNRQTIQRSMSVKRIQR
jgi:hypothetical protein